MAGGVDGRTRVRARDPAGARAAGCLSRAAAAVQSVRPAGPPLPASAARRPRRSGLSASARPPSPAPLRPCTRLSGAPRCSRPTPPPGRHRGARPGPRPGRRPCHAGCGVHPCAAALLQVGGRRHAGPAPRRLRPSRARPADGRHAGAVWSAVSRPGQVRPAAAALLPAWPWRRAAGRPGGLRGAADRMTGVDAIRQPAAGAAPRGAPRGAELRPASIRSVPPGGAT